MRLPRLLALLIAPFAASTAHSAPTPDATPRPPAPKADTAAGLSTTPDAPRAFGYKTIWLAIPTTDTAKVIKALGLVAPRPANWASGLGSTYGQTETVFVSPPVQGWTFVVGHSLPMFADREDQTKSLRVFQDLGAVFPTLYGFGTHRVVSYNAWVKVTEGKIARAYAYADGTTLYETGAKTPEETKLGFAFFDERSDAAKADGYFDRTDLRFSTEEDVVKLAAAWTLDPLSLGTRTETGVGFVAGINPAWSRR